MDLRPNHLTNDSPPPATAVRPDSSKELELLILSRYPIVCIECPEEDQAEKLLRLLAGRLMKIIFRWQIDVGLFIGDDPQPIPNTTTPAGALCHIALSRAHALYLMNDLQRYLDDASVSRRLKEAAEALVKTESTVFLMGRNINLSDDLQHLSARFALKLPDPSVLRQSVLSALSDLQHRGIQTEIRLDESGWQKLLNTLNGLTRHEAERAVTRVMLKEHRLGLDSLDALLQIKKELWMKDGLLEFYSPEELLTSVGGMPNLKSWLVKRKGAFSPEAKSFGITPPKGILLTGIPGCGKSLAAKAVAHEWSLPLLRLDPASLYDKFIGGSEENLRKALQTADNMAPCVLFIDELEKGFSYSQSSESDAGLSRRLFGSFLTWMQDHKAPVFLFATSNDISVLPPEFLRKGRFDEIFFVDLPSNDVRKDIWALHLVKRQRDPKGFDLDALANATDGFSGAEIEQVLVNALYSAFAVQQPLTTPQILEEAKKTMPMSVTMQERVSALREWAKERAVFA